MCAFSVQIMTAGMHKHGSQRKPPPGHAFGGNAGAIAIMAVTLPEVFQCTELLFSPAAVGS